MLFPHWHPTDSLFDPLIGFKLFEEVFLTEILLGVFADTLDLRVRFITDTVGICSSMGDKKVKRLRSCISGTLGHNVKVFTVWLDMQLIEYDTINIEIVLELGSADSA